VEPGRYRVRFALGADSDAYTGVARLLERVRHWRATEVREEDEPISPYHATEMAWCAERAFGKARIRLRRWCSRSDYAHTAPLPLGGSSPDLDPGWQVPDFPPQAWGEPAAEEPPD